jgi:hypothetical protein
LRRKAGELERGARGRTFRVGERRAIASVSGDICGSPHLVGHANHLVIGSRLALACGASFAGEEGDQEASTAAA